MFTGPGVHLTIYAQTQRGWCENILHCHSQLELLIPAFSESVSLSLSVRDRLKGTVLLEMRAGIINI